MLISVVIPVFNVELYLKQCIDSVLAQTYSCFEIICINDGSTDNCDKILSDYEQNDNRIKVYSQQNKGLSATRNIGISIAKGDYILFLDSDDYLIPDTLRILVNNLLDEDLICFNGRRFFEDGTEEDPDSGIVEENIRGWDYYNKYALNQRKFNFVCVVLRLYKRDFLLLNNLLFEEGIFHEDNLFTPIAFFYANKVKSIPDILYIYRIRKGSITQSSHSKRLFDMIFIANKLSEFFIPKTEIDKSVIYREVAGLYFRSYMPEERNQYSIKDFHLNEIINWLNFKKVSVYPRHKRIYILIKIHPGIFRLYFWVEKKFKNRN